MASFNKIHLTGKLNDVPDVKVTTSGYSLAKFTITVPRVETISANTRFDTIQVTTWREMADQAANFKKGDILFVDGRILIDSYDDASGQRKWTTSVDARQVVNLNDVFSISSSDDGQDSGMPPSFDAVATPAVKQDEWPTPPTQTIPIQPVKEAAFFRDAKDSDKNELEEEVPF